MSTPTATLHDDVSASLIKESIEVDVYQYIFVYPRIGFSTRQRMPRVCRCCSRCWTRTKTASSTRMSTRLYDIVFVGPRPFHHGIAHDAFESIVYGKYRKGRGKDDLEKCLSSQQSRPPSPQYVKHSVNLQCARSTCQS